MSVNTPPLNMIHRPDHDKELAKEFFGKPEFYGSYVETSEATKLLRQKKFGDETVKEVIEKWNGTLEEKKEIKLKIRQIGALVEVVENYLDGGNTIEKDLHGQIVNIGHTTEIPLVKKCFVDLDSTRVKAKAMAKEHDRCPRPIFVMGPSGIGKTFFAVKQMATAKWEAQESSIPYTTLYLYAFDYARRIFNGAIEAKVNPELLDDLKRVLRNKYDRFDGKKLRMNVSVIFDEAGSSSLCGSLEVREKLSSLLEVLSSLVEENFQVLLICCGTGLTGEQLSSTGDVIKIQMESWTTAELKSVARAHFNTLTEEAVDAIARQPILRALTTNSRAAWFTLAAAAALNSDSALEYSWRGSWDSRLTLDVQTLVSIVVEKYINRNALRTLSADQRRRVAAWVFLEVENSRKHMGTPYLPKFDGLDDYLHSIASAMITLHVDNKEETLILVPDAKVSVTLLPAITVILFCMLNVSTRVITTWKGLEHVAALYQFRQVVLEFLRRFAQNMKVEQTRRREGKAPCMDHVDKLNNQLARLQLVEVCKRVPETASDLVRIEIPRFGQGVVWKNAAMAPFANLISPYVLVQVSDKCEDVELLDECLKCGLLKSDFVGQFEGDENVKGHKMRRDKVGKAVLFGLCKQWDADDEGPSATAATCVVNEQPCEDRYTISYPENAYIAMAPSDNPYAALELHEDGTVIWNRNESTLALSGDNNTSIAVDPSTVELRSIVFVLYFSSACIKVSTKLSEDKQCEFLVLKPSNFNADGMVDKKTFATPEEKNCWDNILGALRKNVTLKFVKFV